eukprot:1174400-Amphidinium_carterae.1
MEHAVHDNARHGVLWCLPSLEYRYTKDSRRIALKASFSNAVTYNLLLNRNQERTLASYGQSLRDS